MTTRFKKSFEVLENRRINAEYVVITLQHDGPLPEMYPGQFVQVKVDGAENTFLRRPISIHDVDESSRQIKLLVREVGEGTVALGKLSSGAFLNLLFPLGNCFTIPADRSKRVLLVGGGCGIAPMLFLGKRLLKSGFQPVFLFGARTQSGLIELEEFEKLGKVYTTTEDGSHGTKGYVIHSPVLRTFHPEFDVIYTCGPDAMMRVIAKYATQHKLECQVSLENTMACGFGVCLCCVTDTVSGHRCVCTEGPVFDSKELKW